MKTFLITTMLVLFVSSFASATVLDDAITWMYNNRLTIHDNKTDFNADRGLRRDEAAKFFVNFAKQLSKTTYVKTENQCIFSDINDSWSDLKDIVIESCRLGLFQGSKGNFNPKNQITNAQATAVLVRLLTGNQNEIGLSHRADNYYTKANELGVLQSVNMNNKDSIATRGNVGVVIYNGNNLKGPTNKKENIIYNNSTYITGVKYFLDDKNNNYLIFSSNGEIFFNVDNGLKKIGNYEVGLSHDFEDMEEYKQIDGKKIIEYSTGNIRKIGNNILDINILGRDGVNVKYLIDTNKKEIISTYTIILGSLSRIGEMIIDTTYDEKNCVLNKLLFNKIDNRGTKTKYQELNYDIKIDCRQESDGLSNGSDNIISFDSYNQEKQQMIFDLDLSLNNKKINHKFGFNIKDKSFIKIQ